MRVNDLCIQRASGREIVSVSMGILQGWKVHFKKRLPHKKTYSNETFSYFKRKSSNLLIFYNDFYEITLSYRLHLFDSTSKCTSNPEDDFESLSICHCIHPVSYNRKKSKAFSSSPTCDVKSKLNSCHSIKEEKKIEWNYERKNYLLLKLFQSSCCYVETRKRKRRKKLI